MKILGFIGLILLFVIIPSFWMAEENGNVYGFITFIALLSLIFIIFSLAEIGSLLSKILINQPPVHTVPPSSHNFSKEHLEKLEEISSSLDEIVLIINNNQD